MEGWSVGSVSRRARMVDVVCFASDMNCSVGFSGGSGMKEH